MGLNYRVIGQRIMFIRKQNHISQLRFSELIDKSPAYVSYIETGKKSMSLNTFVQIANVLGITADMLLAEQLTGSAVVDSQELAMLLEGCGNSARVIITDVVKALKVTLHEHGAAL